MMSEKIIILLIFLILISQTNKNKNYESLINRYNKLKKNIISLKDIKEDLFPFIAYVKFIKEGKAIKSAYKNGYSNPKVSIIASVFNKEKYLESFITSIQMQDLNEIEAIFVDDFSTDKSNRIINSFIKTDRRIKLIKNQKNMGSLYSRAIGGKIAKGNYIIFFDTDDIILKEGILKAYNHIVKYNLDIVQFLSIHHGNKNIYIKSNFCKYKYVIKQPILSYIFYFNNTGVENNVALWDKLVKKQVVLNSLKYIGEKYIQDKIIIENDVILLFSIFKMAESYQFIPTFGYYYFIANKGSISNSMYNLNKSNEIIYSVLTNIKFLYEKSNKSNLNKYFCIFKIKQSFRKFKKNLKYARKQFAFIKDLFNGIFFNSKFISNKDKLDLMKLYLTLFKTNGSIRK